MKGFPERKCEGFFTFMSSTRLIKWELVCLAFLHSLSSEGEDLQLEALQETAAHVLQKAWRSYMCRQIYSYFKEQIRICNQQDPRSILKTVNPREAELLDAAAGAFIRFRLGGICFPPDIYYKIFTHRPIADVCASSPEDYTQPDLRQRAALQPSNSWTLMQGDRSRWYQRMENNSWRLFKRKMVPDAKHVEIGENKKMDFHHSKLQRQHDLFRWKKRRKIEWLKSMYSWGRVQAHSTHPLTAPEDNSHQELLETTAKGDDDLLHGESDELLGWASTLNFEEYIEKWKKLACSQSSMTDQVSTTFGKGM